MPYAVGTCRGCGREPELDKTRCAAVVQDVTAAYLSSVLDEDGRAWAAAQHALTIGRIDSK